MSLLTTLGAVRTDPLLSRLLARAAWPAVAACAEDVAALDLFGEHHLLARALEATGAPADDVARFFEHQLWCAWREVRGRVDPGGLEPLEIEVRGGQWIEETAGHPVVLCAPMTTPIPDTIAVVCRQLFPERTVVLFGQGVTAEDLGPLPPNAVVADDGDDPMPHIRSVLAAGGVFCTYADFVYDGRSATLAPFFGGTRPVSTGYLSLLAEPGTHLLPLTGVRLDERRVAVHADESVVVDTGGGRLEREGLAELAALVGAALEDAIRRDPAQWLLLPTMTFESPQLADA